MQLTRIFALFYVSSAAAGSIPDSFNENNRRSLDFLERGIDLLKGTVENSVVESAEKEAPMLDAIWAAAEDKAQEMPDMAEDVENSDELVGLVKDFAGVVLKGLDELADAKDMPLEELAGDSGVQITSLKKRGDQSDSKKKSKGGSISIKKIVVMLVSEALTLLAPIAALSGFPFVSPVLLLAAKMVKML